MAGENFDAEQSKIAGLEKKSETPEKTKSLHEKLLEKHTTFFNAVDDAEKTMGTAAKELKDPNDKMVVDNIGTDIQRWLVTVASTGEGIYQKNLKGEQGENLEKIDVGAGKINADVKDLSESLPVLKACEMAATSQKSAKGFLDQAKQLRDSAAAAVEDMTPEERQRKVLQLVERALETLGAANKELLGVSPAVPGDLASVYAETRGGIDAGLDEVYKMKCFYEALNYLQDEKKKKYFTWDETTGTLKPNAEFDALSQDEKDKLMAEVGEIGTKAREDIREKSTTPVLMSIDRAMSSARDAEKTWIGEAEKILKEGKQAGETLTEEKQRDAVTLYADKAVEILASAKQALLEVRNDIPESLLSSYQSALESVNAELEKAANLKLYYEKKDFSAREEYREYFTFNASTGEMTAAAGFHSLPEEKQQQILQEIAALHMKIRDEIDEECTKSEEEKRYFSGKQHLSAGEMELAKVDLLAATKFFEDKKPASPEDRQKSKECREFLKQIAKTELAMATHRLQLMKDSLEGRYTELLVPSGNYDIGVHHSVARLYIEQMGQVLKEAETRIESGEALTLDVVYRQLMSIDTTTPEWKTKDSAYALRTFQKGFESGGEKFPIFDVLAVQRDLGNETDPKKREEKVLALAKEARELGLPELAKEYYNMYFSKEIHEYSQKIDKTQFIRELRSNTDMTEQIQKRMDALKPELRRQLEREWNYRYYPDGRTAEREKELEAQGITFDGELQKAMDQEREKAFSLMADAEYLKTVKKAIHRDFQSDVPVDQERSGQAKKVHEWNEAYGSTFVNLETIDKKWYQFWKFDDAEWNRFKPMFIIDIATMIAGLRAAKLGVELVGAGLRTALTSAGVAEITINEAWQKGGLALARLVIEKLGVQRAAAYGLGQILADNTAYFLARKSIQEFMNGGTGIFTDPKEFFAGLGKCILMTPIGYVTGALGGLGKGTMDKIKSLGVEAQTRFINGLAMMSTSGVKITEDTIKKLLTGVIVF